jgi:hypothetical protein
MSSLGIPAHEATTAQLGAAYPFASARPLPARRVLVGRDLTGGTFAHDPFSLYRAGVLTNPNMAVVGQIGRGKSAFVKTYLYRHAAFGRQVAVLDPKGEYAPLALALGARPIRLAPDGGVRINPLDGLGTGGAGTLPDAGLLTGRQPRLVLLRALAEATMHRRVLPREQLAVEVALDTATSAAAERRERAPTLPGVVAALLQPGEAGCRAVGVARSVLEEDGRDIGLELRRLVFGDLAGMFDGSTTPGLDSRCSAPRPAPLVVDLSAVYHSEALAALMVCSAAWLESMTATEAATTLLVVDEAWAVLSEVAVARYLRSSWKLARAKGLSNIAVCHRVSDLAASGSAGSETARLAEGLLADSETIVCYAQPASELPGLADALGCTEEELAILTTLPRGVALWRVAGRSFLVEHLLSSLERPMVDTDGRLRVDEQ